MSEETQAPAPVRLEMSKRTKIGCFAVPIVTLILVYVFCTMAMTRGREAARATATRLYELAQKEDYDAMKVFVTESGVLTLKKAAEVNGKITAWQIFRAETGLTGRPSGVYLQVTRSGKQFVDEVVSLENERVAVVVENPKEDFDNGRYDHEVRVIAKADEVKK